MRLPLWTPMLALLMATACGLDQERVEFEVGDVVYFQQHVEPELEARCASAGCHGRADRPFSLYAPGQYRADPERRWLNEALTDAEITENARRTAAFAIDAESPTESLIVQKPLSMGEGGLWHGGGDIFVGLNDRGCAALISWLTSATIALDGGSF